MKITVELPQELLDATRRYAIDHDKTFEEVLTEALRLLVGKDLSNTNRPGWEPLSGEFKDDPEILALQRDIDTEFSRVDPEDWK